MIGIGWTEMLVIGVVALIFIGPKELPALMQRVGKILGAVRRMGSEFQREINRTTGLDAVTDIRKSITDPLRKTTAEIAREFNTMTSTGTKPSGLIKPADPKAESVVSEIKAAAGMTSPAEPVKSGAVGAIAPAPAPVMTALASPAPTVAAAPEVPAPTPKAPRKRAARKVESPGPVEALVPATDAAPKPPRKRAAPRKKPEAEPPANG